MSGIRITNCHVHCFTRAHAPSLFPHPAALPFLWVPLLLWATAGLARAIGQHPAAGWLDRLYRFKTEASARDQGAVLDGLIPQYPDGTRFVVLPMELGPTAPGRIARPLRDQHDELARLCDDPRFSGRILPFATVFPDHPGAVAEVRRCIEDLGFRGLKIYPRLGFAPDHPALMAEVYPMLQEKGLPVMSHCSHGGVTGRGVPRVRADRYSSPLAMVPVLEAFPEMKVCLAHFGGEGAWRDYIEDGIDPRGGLTARQKNWQVTIRDMITGWEDPETGERQKAYGNLWTDISYTLFHFEDFVPFLRQFLQDARVAEKVLFGSDYYMTRQQALSERAVCFRLRTALGEDLFAQIAERNPAIWLGEREG